MNRSDFRSYLSVFALTVVTAVGFFFMFEKISSLETSVKNLELQNSIGGSVVASSTVMELPDGREKTQSPNDRDPSRFGGNASTAPTSTKPAGISTAIIVSALSSTKLQPQTILTVSVENVSRSGDGTITVGLKAFTNAATAYSSFDPASIISILNLNGDDSPVGTVSGLFDSIPPKSAAAGVITFKTDPSTTTAIIQVGEGDNVKYYEFNFSKMTYRETIVG